MLQILTKLKTDLNQSKKHASIDSTLTMDKDCLAIRILQESMEFHTKEGIPIGNGMFQSIMGIETVLFRGILGAKPRRRIFLIGTVNDVGNLVLNRKRGSEHFTGSHKNGWMQINRWITVLSEGRFPSHVPHFTKSSERAFQLSTQ